MMTIVFVSRCSLVFALLNMIPRPTFGVFASLGVDCRIHKSER